MKTHTDLKQASASQPQVHRSETQNEDDVKCTSSCLTLYSCSSHFTFILIVSLLYRHRCMNSTSQRPCQGGLGPMFFLVCLNFETSHIGVYKCFTLLLEIEQTFFVFVRILEKGDSQQCLVKKPLQFCSFSVNILHIEQLFTINTIHRRV